MDCPTMAAPAGFHWHTSKAAWTSVLVPEGWFVHETETAAAHGLFVSKENIAVQGEFRTGFSLNAIDGFSKKYGVPPSVHAAAAADRTLASAGKVLRNVRHTTPAGIMNAIVRFRCPPPDARIVHALSIADDASDFYRWILFEAPEPAWDRAWRKSGEVMLKNLWLMRAITIATASGSPVH